MRSRPSVSDRPLCRFSPVGLRAAGAQSAASLPPALAGRVDRIGFARVHLGRTLGLAIGVVEDGRLVYAQGFGFASLSPHSAMTPETEFYAGGVAKQFTAAAILLLEQDGKLKLDDSVTKYVPEFRLGANVTIAQLLTQTSGLPNYIGAPGVPTDYTRPVKMSDLLAAADKLRTAGGTGSRLRQRPAELSTARTHRRTRERRSALRVSQQHIFIPLMMDHTFLAGDTGISPSHAAGYTRGAHAFLERTDVGSVVAGRQRRFGYDHRRSRQVGYRDADAACASTPCARCSRRRQAKVRRSYGMGWVIDRRGGSEFVWANGEISGYRAMNACCPAQHVGVIVFSNADSLHGGVTIPEEVAARVLDVLVPPSSARLDNAVVTRAKEWLARLAYPQSGSIGD